MFEFWDFCPIKIYLSGNTVWLQTSGFQKLVKIDFFLAFLMNFLFTQNVYLNL